MSLNIKKLFYNSSFLLSSGATTNIILFLQGIAVVKTLGPENFGMWGILQAYCSIFQTFFSFRTSEAITKYLPEYKQTNQNTLLQNFIRVSLLTDFTTRIVGFAVSLIFLPFLLNKTTHNTVFIAIFIIYSFAILFKFADQVWYSLARDQRKFKYISFFTVIISLIQFLSVIIFYLYRQLNILNLAIIFLLSSIISLVFKLIFVHKNIRFSYGIPLIKTIFGKKQPLEKEFWKFMTNNYIASSFSSLAKGGDILIISYFGTLNETGYYKLAKSMGTYLLSIGRSFSKVIFQDFSEIIAKKDTKNLFKDLWKMMKIWLPFIFFFVMSIYFMSPFVIEYIYGIEFIKAVLFLKILIIGFGIATSLFWVQPLILSMGKSKAYMFIMITYSITSLLLMSFLGLKYGTTGVTIANSFSWGGISVFMLLFVKTSKIKQIIHKENNN